MRLATTRSTSISDLEKKEYDLILTASGYESRCSFLVNNYSLKSYHKICFGFEKQKDQFARNSNDAIFKDKGFTIIDCASGSNSLVIANLTDILKNITKDEINILVDYSSMSRVWYSSLLSFFRDTESLFERVNIYFSYTFSKFIPAPEAHVYNKIVGPLDGFYTISIPNKPTALIIGLGYIEERAFGLSEFLDAKPYLFISDPSVSQEFYEEVINNNKHLLENSESKDIFLYPLNNLPFTETLLFQLCNELNSNFRVILAPCGPKPFTLVCLLLALRIKNIDVWRISAGDDDIPIDKAASGEINILEVCFKKS